MENKEFIPDEKWEREVLEKLAENTAPEQLLDICEDCAIGLAALLGNARRQAQDPEEDDYTKSVAVAEVMEKAAKMMAEMRENVPATIGGATVTGVRDYKISLATDLQTGKTTPIDLPKSNVLELLLGDCGSVVARPSGTEPKVKFYYTAVGATAEESKELLKACAAQMAK